LGQIFLKLQEDSVSYNAVKSKGRDKEKSTNFLTHCKRKTIFLHRVQCNLLTRGQYIHHRVYRRQLCVSLAQYFNIFRKTVRMNSHYFPTKHRSGFLFVFSVTYKYVAYINFSLITDRINSDQFYNINTKWELYKHEV
jgi:hypothetical protein